MANDHEPPEGGPTVSATRERALRDAVIATAREMNALGINRGKSGNVSARWRDSAFDGYLITPTGLPYADLAADDIVAMPLDGDADAAPARASAVVGVAVPPRHLSRRGPTSDAIVHTHAPFATSLACLDRGIPAFHYMVAVAGGNDIRCAPYATFGTQALSDHAVAALEGRRACLLANHGMIATGASLAAALALAVEVETLAEMYWRALQIGEPVLLADDEMNVVLERFLTYGQAPDE